MTALLDLTRDLRQLGRVTAAPENVERLLGVALEALSEVIPYDLAAIFELEGRELKVRIARGKLASPAVQGHGLDLDAFPSIARSLRTRRPVAFLDEDHAGSEGDPFDGVLDLPHGHSCMVVPLHARDRTLGALTFDRALCQPYSPEVVRLAGVYGELIGLALELGDHAQVLARWGRVLEEQNRLLKVEARGGTPSTAKLEASRAPAMQRVVEQARQVATTDAPVLLSGETGAGKEVVAHAIHDWSPRRGHPFIAVNCAALPENLVESELFGHVKGAFSGATRDRLGRFQSANGGTLLLDELGELPLALQGKLLRVLQEGTFEPVGSDRSTRVDVRVVAATHVDLAAAVEQGRFREDLYYRLAVFPLRIPPLRERPEDIAGIAGVVLGELHRRSGRGPWALASEALAWLEGRRWDGNVRELANLLERVTILAGPGTLGAAAFAGEATPVRPTRGADRTEGEPLATLAEVEREHIARALEATGGKLYGPGGAAECLGMKPSTLQARMRKHGLARATFAR